MWPSIKSLKTICTLWLAVAGATQMVSAFTIVTDPNALWQQVLAGARDIVIRQHMDLRSGVLVGNITQMAQPGLLAPRNSTRSIRVRIGQGAWQAPHGICAR